MGADETKEALRDAGARRSRAKQEARLSPADRALVRRAVHVEELSVTEVARLLGVSRPSVYALLADQEDAAE